ncbi:MAG: carboxyl transferase domain-containing protein [Bacteroidales bacterium]
MAGYAEIFERNILASGVIPQTLCNFRSLCRRSSLFSSLTDFIIMSQDSSYMFVTGPKVTKTVTGEDISTEDLGGANVHATKSGVAQFVSEDEEEGLLLIGSCSVTCRKTTSRIRP